MGKTVKVEGYEAFLEKLNELKDKTTLFLLFSGSKDSQSGRFIGRILVWGIFWRLVF